MKVETIVEIIEEKIQRLQKTDIQKTITELNKVLSKTNNFHLYFMIELLRDRLVDEMEIRPVNPHKKDESETMRDDVVKFRGLNSEGVKTMRSF